MTDYTKLIERLRSGYQGIQLGAVGMGWDFDAKTIIEAAEAIEALAAENERLKSEREALRDSAKEVVRLRDALQAKLNAMGKGEPAAHSWVYVNKYGLESVPASRAWCEAVLSRYGGSMFPLYAAPKALAPLTDESIKAALAAWFDDRIAFKGFDSRMRAAIEAAHGIGGTP